MYSPKILEFSRGLGSVLNIKSIEQDVPTYFNMKSKLAVFDFDLTIRDPEPGNDRSYGVGHLFPGGKLPEELIEIRKFYCSFGVGTKICFLLTYILSELSARFQLEN